MKNSKRGIYRRFIKRPMDFILALIAIIVLSPILLLVATLVRMKLGSPVLFKQKRPGLNEKIFTMYKFRTMTDERDENRELLPDSERLTEFGKFLRSTSLDELPELFNILKGNMGFVGPRPQLIKDMVFFNEEQMKRQTVIPGLTGWAQINGRNSISWEDKFKYDLEYIQNITFLNDIRIVFRTFIKVFARNGISSLGMVTAEDFGDYLLKQGKITVDLYDANIQKSKELVGVK